MKTSLRTGPPAVQPMQSAKDFMPNIHLGYLDSLRALAAIYVVMFHAIYQIDPRNPVLTGAASALRYLFDGHSAVGVFIVLSGLCLMLPVVQGKPVQISMIDFVVGVSTMAFLIIAGPNGIPWLHWALSWKPLAFVGTFAYSIYLFHAPLLPLLWQHCVYPLHLGTLGGLLVEIFVITPIVVAITYVLYLGFERPFLKRRILLDTK